MESPVLKPRFRFAKNKLAVNPVQKKYQLKNHESKLNSVVLNGRTYETNFSSKQLASIYSCPKPNYSKNITIGVISLGGGLVGTLTPNILLPDGKIDKNSGTLTDGDIQAYWKWQGIPSSNWPTVIVKSIDGTKNSPTANPYSENYGGTIENTLDVETIGSWCPSSNATIIMYLAKNNNFYGALNYIVNSNVITSNTTYVPSVVSISWGAPESEFSHAYALGVNILCSNAVYKGINICVAAGDTYSQDSTRSNVVDFPSSSAWVTACGGTSLVCPGNVYTKNTVETVWNDSSNNGGTCGGISMYISKPLYQSNITQSSTKRCVPDIAFNSDPYSGSVYYINGNFMEGIGGTSVATSAMAGLIASLDINTFINPIIYSASSDCFHDITTGSNTYYSANPGYDLCTGRGSIIGNIFSSKINSVTPIQNPSSFTTKINSVTPIQLVSTIKLPQKMANTYFKHNSNLKLNIESLKSKSSGPYFTCSELASIYGCPSPPTNSNTIGVISLGGGLFGTLSPTTGILTNGDVQKYWTSIGIPDSNHPRVIIKTLGASTNTPSSNQTNATNYGASIENTIDVETIGGWYPSSKLTIIMYLANQYIDNNAFYNALNYAINSNVVIGTNTYSRPSTISVSWGFPEVFNQSIINSIQPLLSTASGSGINIFCATGDNGSTDGVPGSANYTDYPSSSPFVVACGGTTLICPNRVYDSSTGETTWNNGGGGISRIFSKPSYQTNVTQSSTKRCIPDISLNANPTTGMFYTFANKVITVGGTSTVAPAMAAFTSILNINYFLNTKLYTINQQSFRDIVSGNNGGYTAGSGYDLCTGRGSLNGTNFISFLNPIATTGITLSPLNPIVKLSTTVQLTATLTPTNATNKLILWRSSKPNIVSVSSSGLCSARTVGNAIITASQGNISAFTTVSVKLKLTTKNITLQKGKSCIIKLSVDSTGCVLNNNYKNIVDSSCMDGSWMLTGKDFGQASLSIEYTNNDDAGILIVTVI